MKNYLILLSLFLLSSCISDNSSSDSFLPDANGQHGEILLLIDNGLWKGPLGTAVSENLSVRAKGPYLRPEPMFSFFRKDPADLNHMNQMNRNILKFMVVSDSAYTETVVLEENNYYAKNQLFIIVKDSDPNRLLDFAQNKMHVVIDAFNEFEKKQLMRIYRNDFNQRAKEIVENKYGISISIPAKSKIKSDKENFLLIKRDRSKNLLSNDATKAAGGTFWLQQGFMVWSTPYYADSNQLTIENVLKDRDTTLKYNVPGSTAGTYMGTEYTEYYDPEGRVFDYNGHKAVEIRGLWIYDGEVFVGGGGPFVQYSILNEKTNKIVTVCGYVYGPKFEKREYIRELDAILNTITIN